MIGSMFNLVMSVDSHICGLSHGMYGLFVSVILSSTVNKTKSSPNTQLSICWVVRCVFAVSSLKHFQSVGQLLSSQTVLIVPWLVNNITVVSGSNLPIWLRFVMGDVLFVLLQMRPLHLFVSLIYRISILYKRQSRIDRSIRILLLISDAWFGMLLSFISTEYPTAAHLLLHCFHTFLHTLRDLDITAFSNSLCRKSCLVNSRTYQEDVALRTGTQAEERTRLSPDPVAHSRGSSVSAMPRSDEFW